MFETKMFRDGTSVPPLAGYTHERDMGKGLLDLFSESWVAASSAAWGWLVRGDHPQASVSLRLEAATRVNYVVDHISVLPCRGMAIVPVRATLLMP
jgi:hypothetical protein